MDKIVNIHAAKTHLSSLIADAEAGETVVIARAGKPAVTLVPVKKKSSKSRKRIDRTPGFLKGKIWMSDDFDAPLPEEMLAAFRGERD